MQVKSTFLKKKSGLGVVHTPYTVFLAPRRNTSLYHKCIKYLQKMCVMENYCIHRNSFVTKKRFVNHLVRKTTLH